MTEEEINQHSLGMQRILRMTSNEILYADMKCVADGLRKVLSEHECKGPWRVYITLLDQCIEVQRLITQLEKKPS